MTLMTLVFGYYRYKYSAGSNDVMMQCWPSCFKLIGCLIMSRYESFCLIMSHYESFCLIMSHYESFCLYNHEPFCIIMGWM